MSDFHQLILVLSRNGSMHGIKFQLRQESYFTYPIEGEKRWWLDAKIQVIDDGFIDNLHWTSQERSIVQVCLTKGHQTSSSGSLDFFKSLLQDPDYIEAWDCNTKDCRLSSRGLYKCVKCHFMAKLMLEIQQDWTSILESSIPALLANIHQFHLLQ